MKQQSKELAGQINIFLVKEDIYLDRRQLEQIEFTIEERIRPLLNLIEGAANRLETIRETDKSGLHLDTDISRLRDVL